MLIPAIDSSVLYLGCVLSFTDADSRKIKRAVEDVGKYIRAASVLGSYVTLSLIRGNIGERKREAVERAVECIKRCCQTAGDYGVILLIEPLDRYEIDFINTIEGAKKLIEKIGPESLGILADTFHMNIEERPIEASLISVRDVLKHVQLRIQIDLHRYGPLKHQENNQSFKINRL